MSYDVLCIYLLSFNLPLSSSIYLSLSFYRSGSAGMLLARRSDVLLVGVQWFMKSIKGTLENGIDHHPCSFSLAIWRKRVRARFPVWLGVDPRSRLLLYPLSQRLYLRLTETVRPTSLLVRRPTSSSPSRRPAPRTFWVWVDGGGWGDLSCET